MEVLCSSYPILFHHLPPVPQEPIEFPSYNSGSEKAQAIQDKVDKTLQKDTLELVNQPGLGFYSRLFLVQKVTGWGLVIDLSSLNGFVTLTKFTVETVLLVLGSIKKGDVMLSIDLKDAYFQNLIHPDPRPYLQFAVQGKVYQFWALCFGISMAPQVFIRVFTLISEGDLSASVPG